MQSHEKACALNIFNRKKWHVVLKKTKLRMILLSYLVPTTSCIHGTNTTAREVNTLSYIITLHQNVRKKKLELRELSTKKHQEGKQKHVTSLTFSSIVTHQT